MKAIVADDPFPAIFIIPSFGTGEIKETPADPPGECVGLTVCLFEQGQDIVLVVIHATEPRLGGFAVVSSIHLPVFFDGEVVIEIEQKVVGGHDPAGKKIA